jgi:hypothetical protein
LFISTWPADVKRKKHAKTLWIMWIMDFAKLWIMWI